MGGLAKISEGALHLFQGTWFGPLGSMFWETHKKLVSAHCKTDGWMGGLAKIERCKNRERDFAKAKDGWTLHLFQGAWFGPFGQHVFGDA